MSLSITSPQHRLRGQQSSRTDHLHVTEKRWFAVRTSSRHEKQAARELRRAGIEAYVPLREKVCHYVSKTVVRELPLLTGYVFVRICRAEEMIVIRAHYTAGFVRLGPDRRCVTDAEIETLKILSTDRNLTWETIEDAFDFAEGMPVEIVKGPMAGIRGHYLYKKTKKAFVISLGGGGTCLATLEVDPTILSAIDGGTIPEGTSQQEDSRKTLWQH
ncbi:transcription termination/antitermination NusG family protein [Neolewinella antarctica]|uniref:Transcription antitermination factor NusG n=1 Tax=Neolewinella antarctica TaxID=442734 RepID=A0ABX0XA10_9BACT|nr:transcription termination/antitermination NusG family protein [Neolewinella antarctica]NJC26096.1 transcription antitermination factor NusG [Neolewinella antarctica]